MTGIKLNSNNQFEIRNGDFHVTDTELQDQKELLYANKGNFLESPTMGVGIDSFANSPVNRPELEKTIRLEFEKDGLNVVQVKLLQKQNDEYDINVVAERNTK